MSIAQRMRHLLEANLKKGNALKGDVSALMAMARKHHEEWFEVPLRDMENAVDAYRGDSFPKGGKPAHFAKGTEFFLQRKYGSLWYKEPEARSAVHLEDFRDADLFSSPEGVKVMLAVLKGAKFTGKKYGE